MLQAARNARVTTLILLLMVILSACNLSGAPEPSATPTPTGTVTATPTVTRTLSIPTPLPLTQVAIPTARVIPATLVQLPPVQLPGTAVPPATSVVQVPTTPIFIPIGTPQPVRIVIVSPVPGSVVAGNVNVVGTAIHPQFLQYQLAFGPDPNPGNLWYPINVSQFPVQDGTLGIWNTLGTQDGTYQLQLRVWLRDGTVLSTVTGGIRIQNRVATPIPSATPNVPRPIAAFTQSRTQGFTPLTVRFFSQSAGNITRYDWSFGDGQTSSDPNPTHTFNNAGTYPVTLTVTGPGGSSNVTSQVIARRADAPTAAFGADPLRGTAPLRVQFTSQSQGQISNYLWDFGDGTTSTDTNPTHTYNNVGAYNVILTVTGPGGTSIATRQIRATNPSVPAPEAAFTVNPDRGRPPLRVQFTNQSQGNVSTIVWNFGDGTVSDAQNPTHTYDLPGDYVVTLIASGPGGYSTAQQTIRVVAPPPAPTAQPPTHVPPNVPTNTAAPVPVAVVAANPTQGNAPLRVQFSSQGSQSAAEYFWDFGDGRGVSNEPNPVYAYERPGTYTATLTVTAADGRSARNSVTITVTSAPNNPPPSTAVPAPRAAASARPAQGVAPLQVQFSSDGSQNVAQYFWDFGDGLGVSSEPNPVYVYQTPGQYVATLVVTGANGSTDRARVQINVGAPTAVPSSTAVPAPRAAASARPAQGVAPLQVQFSSDGSQNVAQYAWDFGDGRGTSAEPNPVYVYQAPGQYTATLTVTGANGSTDRARVQINVGAPTAVPSSTAVPAPRAAANARPTEGNAPLEVQFTSDGSQNVAQYFWDFGDGLGVSTEPNPVYVYQAPGQYTATLTVTGANGSTDRARVQINVAAPTALPAPRAAAAAQPTQGNAPLQVQFSSQGSQNAAQYAWDFGDGRGTSAEPNPVYVYQAPGQYTVTLTVAGADGSTDRTQVQINVVAPTAVPAPRAAASANPTEGVPPLQVQFSSDGSQNVAQYAWDFGDGRGTSAEPNPVYVYQAPGQYTVTLTVAGADGSTDRARVNINVLAPTEVPAPRARANADPTQGNPPLQVQFSSDGSENVAQYFWDFGDGLGVSSDPNPVYVYQAPGQYTATLTVTGADGRTDSAQVGINVAALAPRAAASANPMEGVPPLQVQFSSDGSQNVAQYAWDFGDGRGTSAEPNPVYVYEAPGQYTVTLTVAGADGSTDRARVQINVIAPTAVPAPRAAAAANPTEGNPPLQVQFSSDGSQNVAQYAWDFGDGVGTSAEPNPVYVYQAPGQYTATLTVAGADGSTDRARVQINVAAPTEVPAPRARANANPTEGNPPLQVQFSSDGSENVAQYFWDFGDGLGVSNEPNPVYVYQAPGQYTATLTVTGADGRSDSAQVGINVAAAAPRAAASANPTDGVAPLQVQFSSDGSQNVAQYAWDFGDGVGTSGEPNPVYVYEAPGQYTVTLTVAGADGSTDRARTQVNVSAPEVPAARARVDASPTEGPAPLQVQFNGEGSQNVAQYFWDFGDGLGVSNEPNPVYVYQAPGQYTATLTVTGADGSTDANSVTINVTQGQQQQQQPPPQQGNNQPLVTLQGHTDHVNSVVWSPDGGRVASGGADRTIILWDVASGQALGTLSGHSDAVRALAWNPNGSALASGGADDQVIVWDPSSGQPMLQLQGHSDDVNAVAWSPDGSLLASGSADDTVIIWNARSGERVNVLTGHTDDVLTVAWSPDGRLIASAGRDNTIILWDAGSGQPVAQLVGHQRPVRSLSFSPNGNRLASGDGDGNLLLWNVNQPDPQATLQGHTGAITSVAWNPAGGTIATGSADTTVQIWDVQSQQPVATLTGHQAEVTSVAWSPNGSQLATASADGTVKIWQF